MGALDIERTATKARPLVGLALGAGATYGWAHIGVIRRLNEAGIFPDIVCGTSVGALVGGFYAAGQLDALDEWARNLTPRRLLGYLNIRRDRSLFGNRLFRQLAEQGRNLTIDEMPVRSAAVATDLATGREVRIRNGSLGRAIAASGACPILFPPVRFRKRWMVDGAMVNPVPVSACRALGAHLVIAVDLFSVDENRSAADMIVRIKRLSSAFGLLPTNVARALKLESLRRCRAAQRGKGALDLFAVMMRSASITHDLMRRSPAGGAEADIVIEPRLGPLFGANQPALAIAAGRDAAELSLSAVADTSSKLSVGAAA